MKKLIPLLVITLSCTFSFYGFFPKELRKVYVPIFKNSTIRYGLEEVVTREFIDAIERDGRLQLVDSLKAGMLIKGNISTYKKEPFEYNEKGEVISYKITVQAEIDFFDLINSKSYLNKTYRGWGTYRKDEEKEEDGIKKAVQDLTQNALRDLFLHGF